MGLYYEVQLGGVENNVYKRLIEYTINGEKSEKISPFGATVLSLPPLNAGDSVSVKVSELGADGNVVDVKDIISFTANNSPPIGVKLLASDETEVVVAPAPPAPEPPVVDETPVNEVTGEVVLTPNIPE